MTEENFIHLATVLTRLAVCEKDHWNFEKHNKVDFGNRPKAVFQVSGSSERQLQRVKTADDLLNFLSVVIVTAPNFRRFDFLHESDQMTLSKAFDELAHGVGLLPSDAAIDTAGLHTILQTAKSAYEAGDVVKGAHLLQDFEEQAFPEARR